jgi:hypothetical protein
MRCVVLLINYKGNKLDQNWIVFICVLHEDKATSHRAEYLARKMVQDETNMFKDEYIFE